MQVVDPRAYLLEPPRGDAANAPSIRSVLELQEALDLLERKAQLLSALDKANSRDMLAVVPAISADSLLGLLDQPSTLVVADGFHANLRSVRDTSDGQRQVVHRLPLDSVPEYGV
jgi:hypothetical protein